MCNGVELKLTPVINVTHLPTRLVRVSGVGQYCSFRYPSIPCVHHTYIHMNHCAASTQGDTHCGNSLTAVLVCMSVSGVEDYCSFRYINILHNSILIGQLLTHDGWVAIAHRMAHIVMMACDDNEPHNNDQIKGSRPQHHACPLTPRKERFL